MTTYSFGGDYFVYAEMAYELSLEAHFRVIAVTQELKKRNIPGVDEIIVSNVIYTVRINPDIITAYKLIEILKEIEAKVGDISKLDENTKFPTRLIDIPVWFNDPWTLDAVRNSRNRHPAPDKTDIEHCAKINGFDSVQAFIDHFCSAPHINAMVGGLPGGIFGVELSEKILEVPKYLKPRLFTPARTVGFGGSFSCFYPVDSAGGYQIFGRSPIPIFDNDGTLEKKFPEYADSPFLFQGSDMLCFRQIFEDEYFDIRKAVKSGTYRYRNIPYTYNPKQILASPPKFAKGVMEVLYNA